MTGITVGELRDLAAPMLQWATLTDVSLVRAQIDSSYPPVAGPYEVESNLAVKGVQQDQSIICHSQYLVQAFGAEDKAAWRVQVEMAGLFPLAEVEDRARTFLPRELNAFAVAIGSTAIHPYVRAYVQDAVSRLGYPGFTLDLMHAPTSGASEDVIEWSDPEPSAFEDSPAFQGASDAFAGDSTS